MSYKNSIRNQIPLKTTSSKSLIFHSNWKKNYSNLNHISYFIVVNKFSFYFLGAPEPQCTLEPTYDLRQPCTYELFNSLKKTNRRNELFS